MAGGMGVRWKARRWVACLMALLASVALGVAGLSGAVATAAADSNSGAGSITVTYRYDGTPFQGVGVQLHRVAAWSEDWVAEPSGAFAGYQVAWPSLNDMSQNELRDLANTLAAYVQRDQVESAQSGETGADGSHVFAGLSDGLYLVTYGAYRNGSLSCASGALLVSLPTSTDKSGTAAGVNVSVEPKTSCEVAPPAGGKTRVEVVKAWRDGDDKDQKRPEGVTVQLLSDGKVVDETELNASNGWRRSWADLDASREWTVVEKTVPDGYTTSVDRENNIVTITNTRTPPATPPTTPPATPPVTPPSQQTPPTVAKTGAAVAGVAALALVLLAVGVALRGRSASGGTQ